MNQVNNIVTTDNIIGVKVKNPAVETLGKIDKLVIDKTSGKVCYVTLGVGGFLGIGEKHIAVPWNALSYNKKEECFILNVNKTQLESAKALNEGWSDWANETWGESVHQQFGTKPYWKDDTRNLP